MSGRAAANAAAGAGQSAAKRYKLFNSRHPRATKFYRVEKLFDAKASNPDRLQIAKYEEVPRQVAGKPIHGQLFGVFLREKQKLKMFYGNLLDRQMKAYIELARRLPGDTQMNLMRELEMRADTLLFRAGFSATFRTAQWMLKHRFVLKNGMPMEIKSHRLHVGDVLQVKPRKWLSVGHEIARAAMYRVRDRASASWVNTPSGMLPYMEINRNICALIVVREPLDHELKDLCNSYWLPHTADVDLKPQYAMQMYSRRR